MITRRFKESDRLCLLLFGGGTGPSPWIQGLSGGLFLDSGQKHEPFNIHKAIKCFSNARASFAIASCQEGIER